LKVTWTNHSLQQLSEIYEYIETDSPYYALQMIDRLTDRSKQIAEFPRSGRIVPEYNHPDVREVVEDPYRIIYKIKKNQIDVLSVIHSAKNEPDDYSWIHTLNNINWPGRVENNRGLLNKSNFTGAPFV